MKRTEFGKEPEEGAESRMTSPSPAVPGKPAPEILAEHTLVQGETLSHLSLKYYGSATREKWMPIYEANRDVIGDDPGAVRPGMELKIPKLP